MKAINLFLIVLLVLSCKNQTKDSKESNTDKEVTQKEVVKNEENVYNEKCVILYMPDSIRLAALEKEKSQEELNAIEYDKTMAMEFLSEKGIPIFIKKDDKQFKFKKSSGEIVIIDKASYQNWGLILFKPEKEPKVVFLNEIAEEYDSYFN